MARKVKNIRCLIPIAILMLIISLSYWLMYHQHRKTVDIGGDRLSSGIKQATLPRRWSDMNDIPNHRSSVVEIKEERELNEGINPGKIRQSYNEPQKSNTRNDIVKPDSLKNIEVRDDRKDNGMIESNVEDSNTHQGNVQITSNELQSKRENVESKKIEQNQKEAVDEAFKEKQIDSDEFEEITLDEKPKDLPQKFLGNDDRTGQNKATYQLPSIIGQKVYPDDTNSAGQEIVEKNVLPKVVENVLPKMQSNAEQINSDEASAVQSKQSLQRSEGQAIKSVGGASNYILIHSGTASPVNRQIHEHLKSLPDDVPSEYYSFSSDRFPSVPSLRPSIGNGILATVVHSASVFMSGVYNGEGFDSHRAAIPSTCSLNVTETEPATAFKRSYCLNVGSGIYSESSVSDTYNMTYQVYAHRTLTNVIVVEVDLVRTDIQDPLKLKISLNRWTSSYDFTFVKMESENPEVSYKVGTLKSPTEAGQPELHVVYDHVPDVLSPPSSSYRTKWIFLSVYGRSKNEVFKSYNKATSLIHGKDELYLSHVRAWSRLWSNGRIDIRADTNALSRAAYSSFYGLLSSIPLRNNSLFVGVSPCGLSHGGEANKEFGGHIMWDAEMWIHPPLLLLHQPISFHLLEARRRLGDTARRNARDVGVKGAMYPWRSSASGTELSNSNSSEPDGSKAPYVSASVAWALLQHVRATHDTRLISNSSFGELLGDISNFLVSKAQREDDGNYSIRGVIPFDNTHGVVNNSPFVNAMLSSALHAIGQIYAMEGQLHDTYTHYAERIIDPFNEKLLIHTAYDTYSTETMVREADAILLGYPLGRKQKTGRRLNDLTFYDKMTDLRASPMTWAMYVINWLEIKYPTEAEKALRKLLPLVQNPFQVWTDNIVGLNIKSNYLSSAGSFLQSIIHGYAGVRLHSDRLVIDPVLPPGAVDLHITGIDYLGSSINLYVTADKVTITLSSTRKAAPSLTVYLEDPEQVFDFAVKGRPVSFDRRRASITSSTSALPVNTKD